MPAPVPSKCTAGGGSNPLVTIKWNCSFGTGSFLHSQTDITLNITITPIHWHFTCCGLLVSVAVLWKSEVALGSGAMQSLWNFDGVPMYAGDWTLLYEISGNCPTLFKNWMHIVERHSPHNSDFGMCTSVLCLLTPCEGSPVNRANRKSFTWIVVCTAVLTFQNWVFYWPWNIKTLVL